MNIYAYLHIYNQTFTQFYFVSFSISESMISMKPLQFYFQCLKANIRTKACSHAARVVSPKFLVDSGVQLT